MPCTRAVSKVDDESISESPIKLHHRLASMLEAECDGQESSKVLKKYFN